MSYNNLFNEALKCFDEGDFDRAEAFARQIFETAPNNPDVLNLLGLTAQAKGLHNEACSYFFGDISLHPDFEKIKDAIEAEGFDWLSLSHEPLADFGGFIAP